MKQTDVLKEFKIENGQLWRRKKRASGEYWALIQSKFVVFNGKNTSVSRICYCVLKGDVDNDSYVYQVDKDASVCDLDNLMLIKKRKKGEV